MAEYTLNEPTHFLWLIVREFERQVLLVVAGPTGRNLVYKFITIAEQFSSHVRFKNIGP